MFWVKIESLESLLSGFIGRTGRALNPIRPVHQPYGGQMMTYPIQWESDMPHVLAMAQKNADRFYNIFYPVIENYYYIRIKIPTPILL